MIHGNRNVFEGNRQPMFRSMYLAFEQVGFIIDFFRLCYVLMSHTSVVIFDNPSKGNLYALSFHSNSIDGYFIYVLHVNFELVK